LRGGEVIELISDLGGGKTTFVRGLARGIGSTDKVASPSFTISRIYQAGDTQLHHFDFYRLHEPGVVAHELAEIIHDTNSIVVIEWADIVQGVLPPARLTVQIRTTGDMTRTLKFNYPKSLSYIVKGLK